MRVILTIKETPERAVANENAFLGERLSEFLDRAIRRRIQSGQDRGRMGFRLLRATVGLRSSVALRALERSPTARTVGLPDDWIEDWAIPSWRMSNSIDVSVSLVAF